MPSVGIGHAWTLRKMSTAAVTHPQTMSLPRGISSMDELRDDWENGGSNEEKRETNMTLR